MNSTMTRRTSLACLLLCLFLMASQANAAAASDSGANQLATGAACVLLTPVYGAFNLVYAGVGAMAGGLTWVFTGGDERSAQKVWDASLKGTYIITPDHLKGRKQIRFIRP